MARHEELKSLVLDIENGIFTVNGRDISESGKELHLDFEDGNWSLMISEDHIYSTSDQKSIT